MKRYKFSIIIVFLFVISLLFTQSCGPAVKTEEPAAEALKTDDTVGSLTNLVQLSAISVRGFGIVAGLSGTGSSECPPALRQELERYISKQVPNSKGFSARQFLDSPNTAIVEVVGTIPGLASPGETFDVRLIPYSGSNTVSLDGGYLYTMELKEMSRFVRYDQYTKTVAEAHGQVFRNPFAKTDESKEWYLLGGATVKNEGKISLAIKTPDFRVAGMLRNRINERFGANTASAVSDGEIRISIPRDYGHNKPRFLQMLQTLPISEDFGRQPSQIESLMEQLRRQENKFPAEIALEAVGKPALDSLTELLTSPDEAVRFHAARSMLYIGDMRAFTVLGDFAKNAQSPYRLDAINAFPACSNRKQKESMLVVLLADPDINVRLAASDQLLRLNSYAVKRLVIADTFIVDQAFSTGEKAVYVSGRQMPRIVLFGSPIRTADNVFVQSDDGSVTLNAKPDEKYVSISRSHPRRPRVIGPIPSSRELSALIRTLGEQAEVENKAVQPGLGISYMEIAALLEKMCRNESIPAKFYSGPMVQISK